MESRIRYIRIFSKKLSRSPAYAAAGSSPPRVSRMDPWTTLQLIAIPSAGFGLLATILASIGLSGVMAFAVARRRKETGIRTALRASPRVIMWTVMCEVLLLLAIGLAIRVPAGMGLGQYVGGAAVRHQTERSSDRDSHGESVDPGVHGGRLDSRPGASRIDPILALRHE